MAAFAQNGSRFSDKIMLEQEGGWRMESTFRRCSAGQGTSIHSWFARGESKLAASVCAEITVKG
jgi:hypothetical protein